MHVAKSRHIPAHGHCDLRGLKGLVRRGSILLAENSPYPRKQLRAGTSRMCSTTFGLQTEIAPTSDLPGEIGALGQARLHRRSKDVTTTTATSLLLGIILELAGLIAREVT